MSKLLKTSQGKTIEKLVGGGLWPPPTDFWVGFPSFWRDISRLKCLLPKTSGTRDISRLKCLLPKTSGTRAQAHTFSPKRTYVLEEEGEDEDEGAGVGACGTHHNQLAFIATYCNSRSQLARSDGLRFLLKSMCTSYRTIIRCGTPPK